MMFSKVPWHNSELRSDAVSTRVRANVRLKREGNIAVVLEKWSHHCAAQQCEERV